MRTLHALDPGSRPSAIDGHSLDVLEYGLVRGAVAARCDAEPGRALAEALAPSTDPEEVGRALDLTDEAIRMAATAGAVDLTAFEPVDPLLKVIGRVGASLTLPEMVALRHFLRLVRSAKGRIGELDDDAFCALNEAFSRLPECREARGLVESILTEEGFVRDDASEELAGIREQMRGARGEATRVLERLMNDPEVGHHLTDRVFTVRQERFVLPVKASAADRLDGTVIDRSARGGTFFVEPRGVAGINAKLAQLVRLEEAEIARILRRVTGTLEPWAGPMGRAQGYLARLDLVQARAKVSVSWKGVRPEMTDGEAHLLDARHPGIGAMVPLEIRAGGEFTILAISGPNTGGKTVCLKTLGLLVCAHQSGLFVPAREGSRLPVFTNVLADIGDEQSLQQNLSTFSGHLVHIARFLGAASRGDLVLLDELGAGTEPMEGAALGMAVLEELHRREATVLATTHHEALKEMALTTAGFENASMEFDTDTAMPTFRLKYGLPGASQALAVAGRYGIPRGVLERARSLLGEEWVEPAKLMERLRKEELRLAGEADRLADLHRTLAAKEGSVARKEERLAGEIAEEGRKTRETLRRLAGEAREEVRRARKELAARPAGAAGLDRLAGETARRLRALEKDVPAGGPASQAAAGEAPAPGRRVFVPVLKKFGEVVDAGGWPESVEIVAAGLRVRLPGSSIDLAVTGPEPRRGTVSVSSPGDVSIRLDLRGKRVEDVIPELERFLDRSLLAGLSQVEILHGKGTGALGKAVWEHLKGHPAVGGFRHAEPERGGAGITLVGLGEPEQPNSH